MFNTTSCIRRLASFAVLSGLFLTVFAIADEPRTTADGLPSVEQILQRHVDTLGGEDALRRHRHRTCIGKVLIPEMQIQGDVRIMTAAPHFFLMDADLGEHGTNRTGYEGSTGWTDDQINGPVLLDGARQVELARQADFYADLNFTRHYQSIELLGVATFHEIESYELKMVDRSDKDVFAYFSIDSGLQVGLKGMYETHEGPMPAETLIADYESFDGVLVPTRYETHVYDIVQHIRIEKVHHEPIDQALFAVPEAIEKLKREQEEKDGEPNAEQRVEDGKGATSP